MPLDSQLIAGALAHGLSPGVIATWDPRLARTPRVMVPVQLDVLMVREEGGTWAQTAMTVPDPGSEPQAPTLLPHPFSERAPRPKGAYLHWALPDALTAGGSADENTGAVTFPFVPNRWLVLRRVPGSPGATASWILASDYLGGHGPSYYANGQATTLGMSWPLANWPGEAALPAGLQPPLTAVGLGDPTFAAYLPNIQHIFAFHDPLTGVNPGTVTYTLCGWYAGHAVDPMSGPEYGPAGWQTSAEWAAVMSQLGWSVGSDLPAATAAAQAWAAAHGFASDPASPRTILPSRTVCHGLVNKIT